MFQLNKLTIRNFMSIGAITQVVEFAKEELVLVLGENLDLGGNDNRNGVGKSTLLNALSYAIYGVSLTSIKRDNLINKTNLKNMLVTVEFSMDGVEYTIERGRKPNVFRLIENGKVTDANEDGKDSDESQGESRHTQEAIVRLVGISHDVFKHIVALSTYVDPFLSLRANDQRTVIEQLLGITKLSEKAEKLKLEIKDTKDSIKEEEFKINAANDSNKRIEQNIKTLELKSEKWMSDHEAKIQSLVVKLNDLSLLDIDAEIEAHRIKSITDELTSECRALYRELRAVDTEINTLTASKNSTSKLLVTSTTKTCPVCSQSMDDATHEQVHSRYANQVIELDAALAISNETRAEITNKINAAENAMPTVITDPFYKTLAGAYGHKESLGAATTALEQAIEAVNPYIDQIDSLRTNAIQAVDYTNINTLVEYNGHQEFLLKLLVNKDSFIRRNIIDQNLSYLNIRLEHYRTAIGLPHIVSFKSDLEVEITLCGKDYDFDNLSRGERTRLILSLSWAYRDVFESMNSKVNLLFVDELIDCGLDASGVEAALALLKKMTRDDSRSVYLISHREELIGRVSEVMHVVKESGFTTIQSGGTV